MDDNHVYYSDNVSASNFCKRRRYFIVDSRVLVASSKVLGGGSGEGIGKLTGLRQARLKMGTVGRQVGCSKEQTPSVGNVSYFLFLIPKIENAGDR